MSDGSMSDGYPVVAPVKRVYPIGCAVSDISDEERIGRIDLLSLSKNIQSLSASFLSGMI
jgi:hypothetical protein